MVIKIIKETEIRFFRSKINCYCISYYCDFTDSFLFYQVILYFDCRY